MSKWKTYRLGDIIQLKSGGTPDKSNPDYWGGSIPWISAKSMYDDFISTSDLFITEEGLQAGSKIAKKDSILLLTRGSGLFNRIPVCYVVSDVAYNQDVKNIVLKQEDVTGIKFLYYWLYGNKELLSSMLETTGIGAGKIDTKRFLNLSISLPSQKEQARYIHLMDLLFDKIELNRRINANLEAQAQALFINISRTCPTQKGILKDLIEIKYGKDHKKLNVGNIPVYGSGGIMRYVDTFIYEKETVLIPRKGSLNNVIYLNTPFWSVDTMFYSVMKYDHIAKYVYFFLKSKDLSAMNAGSAVPSMTTDILYQMEINIPDKTVFETYDTIVSPLFKQIQVNQEENQSLSALRDTLLPKLMAENSVA
ncbi:MAG: restriction endonuclease subunit S [Alistipes sp.]|uniref:restriction endonuclease subunit S n=1 Tax=Alistipes sp. TaxID=1872444 RepID=UPI001B60DE5A|nr:restriction endonuclease subunit S [Alistipes sp.]MBP3528117.1 restriction endonuclease subunit S [Alistipes sp.]